MNKNISMPIAAVMMMALTGCGGASFARGGMTNLKGNETVGVMIPQYRIMAQRPFGTEPISDKADADAAQDIVGDVKNVLEGKGYNVKVIPANDKTADLVKKYLALPRNFRHVVSDIEGADFGCLQSVFKDNGIDRLLLLEGESTVRPSMATHLEGIAVSAAMTLGVGAVGVSGPKPITFTYTSSVTPDGKFEFYNREQFTKNGDFFYFPDRMEFAEHAVNGWLASQK